tara:strand:+ start:18513 stop:18983 length:471 start_codon:yes stop_codon:yes gene_type:complete
MKSDKRPGRSGKSSHPAQVGAGCGYLAYTGTLKQLYGIPDHKKPLGIAGEKEMLRRDIEDILRARNLQLSEVLADSRQGKAISEAREIMAIIAIDRLSRLLSMGEIAKLIGLKRTTMLTASDRWRKKQYGEVVRMKFSPKGCRGNFRNGNREPSTA